MNRPLGKRMVPISPIDSLAIDSVCAASRRRRARTTGRGRADGRMMSVETLECRQLLAADALGAATSTFAAPSVPGDSNGDGHFDQSDIVQVLQADLYGTGRPATFAQGDWNNDGLFDQWDIVTVLQNGDYHQPGFRAEGMSVVAADASNLRITEINFNPHDSLPQFGESVDANNDDYEFVELKNIGASIIELDGVQFIEVDVDGDGQGIRFTFDTLQLAPDDHVVIVRDRVSFQNRFGIDIRIAEEKDDDDNEYGGRLSNSGELLTLVDAQGGIIHQFEYEGGGDWPDRADGGGSSLEISDVTIDIADYSDGDSWRSSSEFGGSPGRDGSGPDNRIVFNEVLPHTDPPQVDMLELHNRSDAPIDITNWYLSDSETNYFKYQIPPMAPVAPGAYQVFTQNQFSFALSSFEGEQLTLLEGENRTGAPLRFVDRASFGASENGVSLGRWPNGENEMFPMAELTLGTENTGPKAGDVIFSEINYHPVDPDGDIGPIDPDDLEFVELYNPTPTLVDLTQWRLDGGIEFDFPQGATIGPSQSIVVVRFDPADPVLADSFRSTFGVEPSAVLYGPFDGQLSNGGEEIRLLWPDEPPSEQPDFIPYVLEDRVDFNDREPWPISADGEGDSLARFLPTEYGDFAESWKGRSPTPGQSDFFVRQPGDANEDGQFDQFDIISILMAGKYLTGQPATWAEGDWTGDGVFDQFDIIAASIADIYLKGPYYASSAAAGNSNESVVSAEAVDAWLAEA